MRNILEVVFVVAILVAAALSGGAFAFNQALLSTSTGSVGPSSPIAHVNHAAPTQTGSSNPTFTYSYATAINANVMLVVQIVISPQITSDGQVTTTYNGHACSDSGATQNNANGLASTILAFCPLGTTTDTAAHNLVITAAFTLTTITVGVDEYSGVAQTLYLDGGAGGAPATSPATTTFSTTTAGAWLVGMGQSYNGAITVSSPMSTRGADSGGSNWNAQYADSNGSVSTGSHSITWTSGSGDIAALALGLVASNNSTAGQYPPCSTNLSYDWSMFVGCNTMTAVLR